MTFLACYSIFWFLMFVLLHHNGWRADPELSISYIPTEAGSRRLVLDELNEAGPWTIKSLLLCPEPFIFGSNEMVQMMMCLQAII